MVKLNFVIIFASFKVYVLGNTYIYVFIHKICNIYLYSRILLLCVFPNKHMHLFE